MASNKKVFLIPAMNSKMWENKINQLNVKKVEGSRILLSWT